MSLWFLVLLFAVLAAQAITARSLLPRQEWTVTPLSDIPIYCQIPCEPFSRSAGPCRGDKSCFCASGNDGLLQECITCLVTLNPANTDELSKELNAYRQYCFGNTSSTAPPASVGTPTTTPSASTSLESTPSSDPTSAVSPGPLSILSFGPNLAPTSSGSAQPQQTIADENGGPQPDQVSNGAIGVFSLCFGSGFVAMIGTLAYFL